MDTRISSRSRVKTVLKALLFTVLFVLLFLYVAAVMQPVDMELINMRGFYAEKKNTLDVVYIGGSICIVCWAPYVAWHEYGITSYSFGKSSLASFSVLPLVREVLAYQSPEVLVIDLRPFEYTDPAISILKENSLACASGMPLLSANRFEILRRGYEYSNNKTEQDTPLSFYFDISRYHSTWKLLGENSFRYAIPGRQVNETKGYLFIGYSTDIKLTDNMAETCRTPVSSLSEENMLELLSYLKEKNQKALFVVTTYSETDEERQQYNYLSDIVISNGFDYVNANDYNEAMQMDPHNDYYNDAHTNIYGAEKYTKFVAAYLTQHYAVPDQSDSTYRRWADGYENWMQQVDLVKEAIQQSKTAGSAAANGN